MMLLTEEENKLTMEDVINEKTKNYFIEISKRMIPELREYFIEKYDLEEDIKNPICIFSLYSSDSNRALGMTYMHSKKAHDVIKYKVDKTIVIFLSNIFLNLKNNKYVTDDMFKNLSLYTLIHEATHWFQCKSGLYTGIEENLDGYNERELMCHKDVHEFINNLKGSEYKLLKIFDEIIYHTETIKK